jgi:AAA domain
MQPVLRPVWLSSGPLYASRVAGADFVRADLHIHTYPDGDVDPAPDIDAYVTAALASGVRVLGVTDHNATRFVSAAIKAAEGTGLLVLPGVEVSTHDGHLLALFAPDRLSELEAFANPASLKLTAISETEQRSTRAMLDLVHEINDRGGLAIPAHVDAADGINDRLKPAELTELLASPALAGLEFHRQDALETWFTDQDADPHRLAAWKARQNVAELRERGLARLMSSDAHSIDKAGQDRSARTLTRLRLDDLNFDAVRLAIQLNPKARCKAEAILPATYPRILRAELKGGFLDGVTLDFSPNLNCVIGGRGSGKSTALLAIRAALGAQLAPDDDPDEEQRMPSETLVQFIDSAGSERTAVRQRGQAPVDAESGSPIRLRLADLGQDESGRLARGYREQPEILLDFLDGFVVKHRFEERDGELLARLEENGAEVRRTTVRMEQIKRLEDDRARLDASLKAAQTGKVELIAEWAALLAAQAPLLDRLARELGEATTIPPEPTSIDIDALAAEYGVDLTKRGQQFVEGADGLRQALIELELESKGIRATATGALAEVAKAAREALERWQRDQADLEARLRAKQTELEAQGLKVQAGAVREIATRLQTVNTSLGELRKKQVEHQEARTERRTLLGQLYDNRGLLYEALEDADGVGDEVGARVWRPPRLVGGRTAGVTVVVADHEPPAPGQHPAKALLPPEHRPTDPHHEEDRRVGGIAEWLGAELNAVHLDHPLGQLGSSNPERSGVVVIICTSECRSATCSGPTSRSFSPRSALGSRSSSPRHYQYNWITEKSQANFYWRIGVQLDDGQVYSVDVGLR